jgi:hypothetical protein
MSPKVLDEKDREMRDRLRGRLMQAEFELARVRDMSVRRHEQIVDDEVEHLRELLMYLTGERPEPLLPEPVTYDKLLAATERSARRMRKAQTTEGSS